MAFESKLHKTKFWFGLALSVSISAGLSIAQINGRTDEQQIPTRPGKALAKIDEEVKNRPIQKQGRGYISSDSCRQCHTDHYDTWHESHHRTMTQIPTKDSVIADFDNKIIVHSGREFRFFHQDDEYFMEVRLADRPDSGKSPKGRTFKIVLMTGAHHQQAFWCETDKRRSLGKIPFIWINKEQRWVPYGSIFFLPSSGGLNMHGGIWNSNCIKCHVVGGEPRWDQEKSFDSHVAEFGISCEACHGPGEAHAAFHQDLAADNPKLKPIGNQQLVNPADLDHVKSSQTCGQCHSVFEFYDAKSKNKWMTEDGFQYRPGDNLLGSRHVFRFGQDEDLPIVKQKLERDPKFWEHQFWSDGMVRVSGREFNGLLETPCYQRGKMSCLSCHDMHPGETDERPSSQWADDQLKLDMRGNKACLQCHQEYTSDEKLAMHTHHLAGSEGSNCYNCHMPHTTLGLMKAMRSHTIDSPSASTTVATGRPNACNLCHLDKPLAWTAQHLEKWYDIEQPKMSAQEKEVASSIRWILQGDAGQRAIAGWHFGWAPAKKASQTQWMAPLLAELLTDSYDVVRFIGYHSLKELPGFSEFEYDFVGPEEARERGRTQALKQWKELEDRPSPSAPLLINERRELIEKEIQVMRSQRLDPPIKLIE